MFKVPSTNSTLENLLPDTLSGGGEMGKRLREYDWSQTALGPIAHWPQSLKTSLSIILNSQHPMWIGWGPELIFFYNDAYLSVLGLAKHSWALGQPATKVWAEIWDFCGPLAEKVFEKGEASFVNNVRLFMNRGNFIEETFYSFSYSPIRDESGKVGGLFCPCTEITEKLLSERRLKTLSELSAKALVEKTVEATCASVAEVLAKNRDDIPFALLYLVSADGKSAVLSQSTGVSKELRGISPTVIEFDKLEQMSSIWPIAKVIGSAQTEIVSVASVEALPLGLAQQRISQALLLAITSRGQNKLTGLLMTGVNPSRKLDTEYRTFYELVAAQVGIAIQNAKAYEKEKKRAQMLEEIDRAKTLFVSNISHELRTPLTLIIGPLEDSLTDATEPLTVSQRERQTLVYRNALRLLKLVNSLLDFSRIEANRTQAVYEPTDLAQLTKDLASVFRSAMEKAGLAFKVETYPLKEKVYVDKEMYEKIIFNLLSNAFKFTWKGSVTVALGQKDNAVELRVEDTGIGIPKAHLPRMFERFHRIESSQGRSYEGSGIGLALIYELVKLHGGTIQIQSEESVGTCFILTFPFGTAHLPKEQVSSRPAYQPGKIGTAFVEEALRWLPEQALTSKDELMSSSASSVMELPPNPAIKNARILLADDNADMRQYGKSLLAPFFQVELVTNGEEALQAALTQPPDLILSDIMMPKVDGLQLVKELRNHPETQHLPIILLSARAGEEARVEGLQVGADDYLVKPFSAKELLARVNTHLELGRLRCSLEAQVKQRTQELQQAYDTLQCETNERIAVEKRLAEEQTRTQLAENYRQMQSDFIDTLCHELRNPLNGIYGGAMLLHDNVQLLEQHIRRLLEPESNKATLWNVLNENVQTLKDYLQAVLQGCEQQKVIVNDVLDLSKLEHNKIEINSVPFKLQQAVQQVIQIFTPEIQKKQLKLVLDLPPEDIILKADVHRFQQIVTNLVSNAVKFTHQGSIEIAAKIETSPLHRLIIQVKDSGIGMSKEESAHLFERFSQAHHSIAKHYGGSGLGLAISKKLVEKMGGNIEVKSEKGHGAQFTFTIQCEVLTKAETLQLKTLNQAPTANMLPTLPSLLNSCLVVEDNPINQKILVNYLKPLGGICERANHGGDAVQKCQQMQFNVILMDIEMPIMDGLEATRLIREHEKPLGRHTPIIGLSGNVRKEQIQAALDAGMDAYLTKPVHRQELYQTIQAQLVNKSETKMNAVITSPVIQDRVALSQSAETLFAHKRKQQEAQTDPSLEETLGTAVKEMKQ